MCFVTSESDPHGPFALSILKDKYEVVVLKEGEKALPGSIALFSLNRQTDLSGRGGRYLRLGKLPDEAIPSWAAQCDSYIAIHNTVALPFRQRSWGQRHKCPSRFADALLQAARDLRVPLLVH